MKTPLLIVAGLVAVAALSAGCDDAAEASADPPATRPTTPTTPAVSESGYDLTGWPAEKAEAAAKKLSELTYYVTQKEGTEKPFTSELLENKQDGVYACAVCDLPVYASGTKFKSGTGWPSFYDEFDPDHVREVPDNSHGMTRTEVECARCGSHLGHVFNDGPEPTGLRHCINGVALKFYTEGKAPQPTTQPAE